MFNMLKQFLILGAAFAFVCSTNLYGTTTVPATQEEVTTEVTQEQLSGCPCKAQKDDDALAFCRECLLKGNSQKNKDDQDLAACKDGKCGLKAKNKQHLAACKDGKCGLKAKNKQHLADCKDGKCGLNVTNDDDQNLAACKDGKCGMKKSDGAILAICKDGKCAFLKKNVEEQTEEKAVEEQLV